MGRVGAILDSGEWRHVAQVVTGLTVADSGASMRANQGVPNRVVEVIAHGAPLHSRRLRLGLAFAEWQHQHGRYDREPHSAPPDEAIRGRRVEEISAQECAE